MAFYKTRSVAYQASKVAGDIGAVSGTSAKDFRGATLGLAKKLGDLNYTLGAEPIPEAGGGLTGRIKSRLFGAGARAGGMGSINSLPPIARRAINRSVGQEMQKLRSHGFKKSSPSLGGTQKLITRHSIAKSLDFGIGIKAYAKIDHVDQEAFEAMMFTDKFHNLMLDAAIKITNDIRNTAPDLEGYGSSFIAKKGVVFGVPVAIIETNDFAKGKWLEYGTIKMGPRPTIRNAFLRAAGQTLMPEYKPLKDRK